MVEREGGHGDGRGDDEEAPADQDGRRSPRALRGDDRPNVRDRPGVDDVARLDPAAPGRRDAEIHLPVEYSARWQSLSIDRVTPAAMARRARAPSMSRCAGAPSTSSSVPVSTAVAKRRS